MEEKKAAVQMRDITKRFGPVLANDRVWLDIFACSYFINTVFKKYTGELAEEQAAWEQAERERKQRKKLQKNGML